MPIERQNVCAIVQLLVPKGANFKLTIAKEHINDKCWCYLVWRLSKYDRRTDQNINLQTVLLHN